MTTSLVFRATLKGQILVAIGAVSAATALGCGDDTGSGAAGAGSNGGNGQGAAAQGGGGESAAGGNATSGGGGAGGQAAGGQAQGGQGQGGGGAQQDVERCFINTNPEPNAACPTLAEAPGVYLCTDLAEAVTAWLSGPTVQDAMCCYQVDVSAPDDPSCGAVGRPFIVEQSVQRAAVRTASGAARSWANASDLAPAISDLSVEDRARLASSWADDASYEHASVASFSKFALELMAFGAPAELVREAHRAALDEVRHAELGFALASSYAGRALEPAALPAAARVSFAESPAQLIEAVIHEGCVGETLAAVLAAAQLAVAEDPAVRAALVIIADDEARHAELGWRTVTWVIRAYGDDMRAVARAAFERAIAAAESAIVNGAPAHHAHGRLSAAEVRFERLRALAEIVRPAMVALLA